jgi:hypothetical protein
LITLGLDNLLEDLIRGFLEFVQSLMGKVSEMEFILISGIVFLKDNYPVSR